MTKPYFHELTEDEFNALVESKITWGDVMQKYSQPDWCEYPNALEGQMGCWGLVFRTVSKRGETYCTACECYKKQLDVNRL